MRFNFGICKDPCVCFFSASSTSCFRLSYRLTLSELPPFIGSTSPCIPCVFKPSFLLCLCYIVLHHQYSCVLLMSSIQHSCGRLRGLFLDFFPNKTLDILWDNLSLSLYLGMTWCQQNIPLTSYLWARQQYVNILWNVCSSLFVLFIQRLGTNLWHCPLDVNHMAQRIQCNKF